MTFGGQDPVSTLILRSDGLRDIIMRTEQAPDPLANSGLTEAPCDYSGTGFRATIDCKTLVAGSIRKDAKWTVVVQVRGKSSAVSGTFKRRLKIVSAFSLQPRYFDKVVVAPLWDGKSKKGLEIAVRNPVCQVKRLQIDNRDISLGLEGAIKSAALFSGSLRIPLRLSPQSPSEWLALGTLPKVQDADGAVFGAQGFVEYQVEAEMSDGAFARALIGYNPPTPTALPFVATVGDGTWRLFDAQSAVVVERSEAVIQPERGIWLSGRVFGDIQEPRLRLLSPRSERSFEIQIANDGHFTAFARWNASEWGRPPTPPALWCFDTVCDDGQGRSIPVQAGDNMIFDAPLRIPYDDFALRIGVSSEQRPAFMLSTPRRDDELGTFNQQRLRKTYSSGQPIRAQVFFESFAGQQASCNPYGIDRALATLAPDLPRFWGVNNAAIPIPPGATRVIQGTREWWEARQLSRLIVTNDWLTPTFTHLPDQKVLQTWHGTMLKRIGLDRPDIDLLSRTQTAVEIKKWDFLLSQNPHSSQVFPSAYRWSDELWEEGYPRNDVLWSQDADTIRKILGIEDGRKVVLYSPTWRETQQQMVDFFDPKWLAAQLGDNFTLLVRGHAKTVRYPKNVETDTVIDVTTYPDIGELFLISDILITDYSSSMFDFSNTGKPMIFFVPDIEQYRDTRGVYFDLFAKAPGAVVKSAKELPGAVIDSGKGSELFSEKYSSWQAEFNPWDGRDAGERVARRLLALS
jgi:CDP-glycerol glycerophosphotransferase (TagB/SpsB family)